jgi:predicted DNA-binding transcriptional regulator AlpA
MSATSQAPDLSNRLVNEKEAAHFLGYTVRALQNWRVRGCGPKFVKVSARSVRYRVSDLSEWVDAHIVSSTSSHNPQHTRQTTTARYSA